MKKIVLPFFSAVALFVGACQTRQPVSVSNRHWFLHSTDFRAAQPHLDLKISYAEMQENRIRLFVHVTDTSRQYQQGIPADLFCSLVVRQNGAEYPAGYRVTEYRQVDRGRGAFAFVLDHSGSMGNNKIRLYQATRELIEKKKEGDAYSIVRYANHTSLDVPLTADKATLLSEFSYFPRFEVGTLTATWDGVVEGIQSLENSPYTNRTLVVFTDGGENASKVTRDWAFWRAKQAGIKVMAVSLGLSGSQNMQDLCESTGGMYVQIDQIDEILQAYTDLYNKQHSYYMVEFETPLQGRQTVQLSLCDSIILNDTYTLNNSPLGIEPQRFKENPSPTTTSTTSVPTTPAGTTYPHYPTPVYDRDPVYTGGSSGTSYGSDNTQSGSTGSSRGGGRGGFFSGWGTTSGKSTDYSSGSGTVSGKSTDSGRSSYSGSGTVSGKSTGTVSGSAGGKSGTARP